MKELFFFKLLVDKTFPWFCDFFLNMIAFVTFQGFLYDLKYSQFFKMVHEYLKRKESSDRIQKLYYIQIIHLLIFYPLGLLGLQVSFVTVAVLKLISPFVSWSPCVRCFDVIIFYSKDLWGLETYILAFPLLFSTVCLDIPLPSLFLFMFLSHFLSDMLLVHNA